MRDDGGTEGGAEEGEDEGGDGGDLFLLTLLSCLSWDLAQGLSALCLYALNCLNALITFPLLCLPPPPQGSCTSTKAWTLRQTPSTSCPSSAAGKVLPPSGT